VIDAAILAGGRARRMGGVDKALLEVGGRRIVDRQAAVLAPLVGQVLLVVGDAGHAPVDGTRLVIDRAPGEGPLAGMAAAFAESAAEALLVFGCDLPFLDGKLVELVRDRAPQAEAVVPRVHGRAQPLHARYARSVVPRLAAQLAAGARRLTALVDQLQTVYLDEPELRRADPTLRGLTNVNTPDELAAARALLG
jgi:molybdopterin-guanine dinucleotide biosynthesis protein A